MIGLDREGGLAIVTLDRPGKANALTAAMLERLLKALAEARDADALILTGAGRVFSAGADLDEVATLATSPLWEEVSRAIARHPGLTVAALNGTAAGGALGMVLACDLRVAAPVARVFYPVMKLGVRPQPSDPGRLAALCGPARAKHLLLASERWDAERALAYGLFDEIDADPVARARALCAATLAADTTHARALKAML